MINLNHCTGEDIEALGFKYDTDSCIIQDYIHSAAGIKLSYYGFDLCAVEINGEDILDMDPNYIYNPDIEGNLLSEKGQKYILGLINKEVE